MNEAEIYEAGRMTGRQQLIERILTYRIKKIHARAYGNMYRLEIPLEEYESWVLELQPLSIPK